MKLLYNSDEPCLPENVDGKYFFEADPLLYEEVRRLAMDGNMSAAACVLTSAESARLVERLAVSVVENRCQCEDDNCYVYFIRYRKPTEGMMYHTVRYYVNGELLIHCDGDGDILQIERLLDGRQTTNVIFAVQPSGDWKQVSPRGPT